MNQPTQVFGPHLLLDCYGADPLKLSDLALVFNFLDTLPGLIGMEKIGPPQLARFTDVAIWGITGVVMIVNSHVTIHTYALKGCCFVDVFSCKQFDAAKVIEHVTLSFKATDFQSRLIDRGERFPKENIHDSGGMP